VELVFLNPRGGARIEYASMALAHLNLGVPSSERIGNLIAVFVARLRSPGNSKPNDWGYGSRWTALVLYLEDFLDNPVADAIHLTMEMHRRVGISDPELQLVSNIDRRF
jgi:hypothetical protein